MMNDRLARRWTLLAACAAFSACDGGADSKSEKTTDGTASGGARQGGTSGGARAGAAAAGANAANGATTAVGGSAPGGASSRGGSAGVAPGGVGSGDGGEPNGTAGDTGSSQGGRSNGGNDSGASGGSATPGSSGTSGAGATAGAGQTEGPITAAVAAANMDRGVNLGQMFENTQHTPTLAVATPKIDAYYAKGFRNLRIPVTWTEAVQGNLLVRDAAVGDVNRQHPRLAELEKIVDYALSKPGLYVVINAHHERVLKTQSRGAVLERLWSDIADIFAARSHRLIFEILNEPHRSDDTPMPPADLRSMTSKAYAKIRAVDPERIVVIGGNQWFGAKEMAEVWPDLTGVGGGDDPYLMATFHHYDPWTFCGDNQGDYSDAWTDANLSQPMATMRSWADTVGGGMPIYIGEWGVGWASRYNTMDCNNIRSWYQGMHEDHAAPNGMPTAVWDDGGWFKIFDFSTKSFANNLIDCITGTCAWTGDDRFNEACL